MRAVLAAGMVVAALVTAAPAYATEGEDRFVADMETIGISASRGFIENNARNDRPVLRQGYQVCENLAKGYSLLDAERIIIVAEASDVTSGNGRDISRDQIAELVRSAKANLCP